MATNIFEDAWNAGKEWASETADDVEKYVTKKVIEKKFNDWGSSVTEALGGPTKMTPELEAAGWKLGIDNVSASLPKLFLIFFFSVKDNCI
jgi:hypothetical protein